MKMDSSSNKESEETIMNYKDIAIRAGKTFVQAFVSALIIQISAISVIDLNDWNATKSVVLSMLISALSAGLSAGWNLITQYIQNKQDGEPEEKNTDFEGIEDDTNG